MKKIYTIIVSAFMILLAVGCQKNDILPDGEEPVVAGKVYTAVMEQAGSGSANTKISVNVAEDGSTATLAWDNGDKIRVVGSDYLPSESAEGEYEINYCDVALTVGSEGSASFTLSNNVNFPSYAVFGAVPKPETAGSGDVRDSYNSLTLTKITLPSSYGTAETPYKSGTFTAPMYADMSDYIASDVKFRHMAGVIKITFLEVPAGYDTFIFTSNNNNICGDFDVIEERYLKTVHAGNGQGNGKSITYTFAPNNDATQAMTFYVPLPLGTYDGFSCELKKNGTNISLPKETLNSFTVTRCKLALMPDVEKFDYATSVDDRGIITYIVYTDKGLQVVNTLVCDDLDANITLGNDIIMPEVVEGESNWIPLGKSQMNGYTGIFNGNNCAIIGLKLNSSSGNLGLVAYLGSYGMSSNTGEIKNLTLINCMIVSASGNNIGAFVGLSNQGIVKDCILKADKTGSVYIHGAGTSVGGIVGNSGLVNMENSISSCSVINNGSGSINIVSSGAYVGGIVGNSFNIIENSKVINEGSGTILINSESHSVGGIVGKLYSSSLSGEISGCIVDNIDIQTQYNVGGIVGLINSSSCSVVSNLAKNINVSQTSTDESYLNRTGGIVGYNTGTTTACYAYMPSVANVVGSGTGTVTSCYYYTSSVTTAGNVFGLDGGEMPWGDAMSDMNRAAGSTGYQCSGTWNTPILNAPGSN